MKGILTSPLLLWPVLACAALSPLTAAPPELRDLLRDGLYKEEVDRDPDGAAKAYQELLARNDEQRAFAATAQFRLAEVRRKQGRRDDAIEAYRQLLVRYPEAETECKLARENLVALGAGSPLAPAADGPKPADGKQQGDDAYLASLKETQQRAPDTLGQRENFETAINQGYAKSLGFLLENATPSEQVPVLSMAVEAGSLEMVKLIFASGVKSGAAEKRMVLALAAAKNQFYIAQELLKQGIDVNGNPDNATSFLPPDSIEIAGKNKESLSKYLPGSALTTAIAFGNSKLVDLFLKANPDVNLQATGEGYTALQLAAFQKDTGLVRELLSRKADPNIASNHRGNNLMLNRARGNRDNTQWRALDFALAGGDLEIARALAQAGGTLLDDGFLRLKDEDGKTTLSPALEALLDSGLKVSSLPHLETLIIGASPEQVKTLLARGLDPNWSDEKTDLLTVAMSRQQLEVVRMLLDAGAKPAKAKETEWPLLRTAVVAGAGQEMLNRLIDLGATMGEEWYAGAYVPEDNPNYQSNGDDVAFPAGARAVLFRRFLLPRMEASPDVRLVWQLGKGTRVMTLKEKSLSPQPGSLEQLLVERKAGIQWQSEAGKAGPVLATIWRRAADGKRTPLQADLRSDAALPALEWGDVVELSYEPEEQRIFGYGSTAVQNSTLPENLVWKLRQRISFPVVVEMDGRAQDFTVRGGLATFDPTRPEVPMMGAAQLARLISLQKPEKYAQESLTVIRQGWPDVRVLSTTEPSADFALQKGDRLKWETQDTSPGPKWVMKAPEIRVCSPGLPFAVKFQEFLGGGGGDGTPRDNLAPSNSLRPTQPSLLQAIATLYGSAANRLKEAPANDPAALAAWLPGALEGEILSVLPHPDLTHIRVRRKSADGAEKIIEIDLQKAMDGMKDGTTAEEARQADLLLQPGDVVELPVDRKALGQPWTGFTAPQSALLEKALSGSVQITNEAGQVTLLPLLYRTPRLTATPGGLVPLPASEGTSSLVLRDVLPDGRYDAVSKDGLLTDMKSDRILLSERFQFLCRSLNPSRPAPRPIPPPPSPARRSRVAPSPGGR